MVEIFLNFFFKKKQKTFLKKINNKFYRNKVLQYIKYWYTLKIYIYIFEMYCQTYQERSEAFF